MILVTLLNKNFFSFEYCGKKQIESGSALSLLLATTIFVMTVAKMLWMTNIVVDKSTDNAEPLLIC